jgi:chromate transporter
VPVEGAPRLNDDTHLWGLFYAFFTAAFFSIGGASALIPEFHRHIVDVNGWMTDASFARAVGLAQIAPGPNMLLVSLIGWNVAGVPGLLISTLAIIGPPGLLAFTVGRLLDRLQGKSWLKALKEAFGPIVVGLMLASGLVTSRAADHDLVGYGLTLVSIVFITRLKRNPLWVIAFGAAVGILAYRLGWMSIT